VTDPEGMHDLRQAGDHGSQYRTKYRKRNDPEVAVEFATLGKEFFRFGKVPVDPGDLLANVKLGKWNVAHLGLPSIRLGSVPRR